MIYVFHHNKKIPVEAPNFKLKKSHYNIATIRIMLGMSYLYALFP